MVDVCLEDRTRGGVGGGGRWACHHLDVGLGHHNSLSVELRLLHSYSARDRVAASPLAVSALVALPVAASAAEMASVVACQSAASAMAASDSIGTEVLPDWGRTPRRGTGTVRGSGSYGIGPYLIP